MQESINLLMGRLKDQITSFKETIAKDLDKDFSLAEKMRMLFRQQGITIASILTAIGMAIGLLVFCFPVEVVKQVALHVSLCLRTKKV